MLVKKDLSSRKAYRSNPRPVTNSSVATQLDTLIATIDAQYRDSRWRSRRHGETVPGILVESDEWEQLVKLWEQIRPRPKGRPELEPSLFGNPYKEEFDKVRDQVAGKIGKQRGSVQRAIAILAKKYRVEPDTMRKRIYGAEINPFDFRKE